MATNEMSRVDGIHAPRDTGTHGPDEADRQLPQAEHERESDFEIPGPAENPTLPLAMDWLDTRYVKVWDLKTSRHSGKKLRRHERWMPLDDRYELTARRVHNSQQDVANAWRDMQYPQHNVSRHGVAELTNSANFRGYQYADGSGRLEHYSTTEAIRTRHGVIIDNQDCWSAGFAHCTLPDDKRFGPGGRELNECDAPYVWRREEGHSHNCNGHHWYDVADKPGFYAEPGTDWTFSVGVLKTVIRQSDASTDEYGITEVEQGETRDGVPVTLAPLETGHMIVVFEDTTARREQEKECITVLSPEEARTVRTPKDALDYLIPDEAAAALAAGLSLIGSEASEDDPRIPGGAVVRQGEWFAIPMEPGEDFRELSDARQENFLGSHRARDCGVTPRYTVNGKPAPGSSDTLGYVGVFGRGWIKHRRGEHERAYLGERWHLLVEDDHDVFIVEEHRDSQGRRRSRAGWD